MGAVSRSGGLKPSVAGLDTTGQGTGAGVPVGFGGNDMARSNVVGLLFEAWNDVDRVLADLSPEDAVQPWDGGSSFAWTLAHVTNSMDAWIVVRFAGRPAHPLIGDHRFRYGGTGTADDWRAIRAGADEVRNAAREYLEPLTDGDLELTIPYDGSVTALHEGGLKLRTALLVDAAHHYYHTGEIAAKRERLGHQLRDSPGPRPECL